MEERRQRLKAICRLVGWDADDLRGFLSGSGFPASTFDLDSKQLHEVTRDLYHLSEYKHWQRQRDEARQLLETRIA